MADVMDDGAIDAALADLDAWDRHDTEEGQSAIHRDLTLDDFAAAMAFVNRVAEIAEEMQHHPDIAISWNQVGLTVSSHEAGGVTGDCIELATRINALG
ncbi:hypothetical protein BH23ACT9_BH23ACT9_00910 [soil metagenome]